MRGERGIAGAFPGGEFAVLPFDEQESGAGGGEHHAEALQDAERAGEFALEELDAEGAEQDAAENEDFEVDGEVADRADDAEGAHGVRS